MYVLVIVFTLCCPASLELPIQYATIAQCTDAAKAWRLSNTARPVLASYCRRVAATTTPPPPPSALPPDDGVITTPGTSTPGLKLLTDSSGNDLLDLKGGRLIAR